MDGLKKVTFKNRPSAPVAVQWELKKETTCPKPAGSEKNLKKGVGLVGSPSLFLGLAPSRVASVPCYWAPVVIHAAGRKVSTSPPPSARAFASRAACEPLAVVSRQSMPPQLMPRTCSVSVSREAYTLPRHR